MHYPKEPETELQFYVRKERKNQTPDWVIWAAVSAALIAGVAIVSSSMAHAPVTAPAAAAGGAIVGAAGTIAVNKAMNS